jgi:alpha-1,2-mannosyltransferase
MARYGSQLAAFSLGLLFIVLSVSVFNQTPSADFRAVWLAGEAFASGRLAEIYPKDASYFTMLPPDAWINALRASGYTGTVFPFIYPPLWAWLASWAVQVMEYETLLSGVRIVNAVLLLGMLTTARRMLAPSVPLSLYLLAGIFLLLTTTTGVVALFENQPQILVAFLTVLAIERAEAGHARAAGIVLAVAAAIKLYPALYALLWLASGQRRAAASFGVAGAALGLVSVAVAGWPLHAEFLHLLGVISDTALITKLCYAWESVIAQIFWNDQLLFIGEPISNPDETGKAGWFVLQKPFVMGLTFKLLQGAALIWMAYLFRQSRDRADSRRWLWPSAFAIFSLLGPIGWSYHYLSLLAFVPAFVGLWRSVSVAGLFVLWALCASAFLPTILSSYNLMSPRASFLLELAATSWITLMVGIFLWQSRRIAVASHARVSGDVAQQT